MAMMPGIDMLRLYPGTRRTTPASPALSAEPPELLVGELDLERREVLLEMLDRQRPGNRQHQRRAPQKPGQRYLALRRAAPGSDLGKSRRRHAPQRKERHEHDPLSRAVFKDRFMLALGQAELVLHGRDRQHLAGLFYLLDADLGEADAPDDSTVEVLGESPKRRLERRLRVDPMQVVEIDAVAP